MSTYDYDFVVIGGGSGGLAAAKRASINHGKKVAVIEKGRLGGTCVNVGCVPKKIMWMTATLYEQMKHDSAQYCIEGGANASLDWKSLKDKRDAYIVKLNNIYGGGLTRANVTSLVGDATFVDQHTISSTNNDGETKTITADKICIATGGRPHLPDTTPGVKEYCISSDGFFDMEFLPKKVVVVGAGYIAVELAGVLNALGSETHLVVRKGKALRNFDNEVSDFLDKEMTKQNITVHRNTNGVGKVEKDESTGKLTVSFANADAGEPISDVEQAKT